MKGDLSPELLILKAEFKEIAMHIKIYITRKGVQRVALFTGKKKSNSIEGLALYAKLESQIEDFKEAVRKAIQHNEEK